MWEVVKTVKGYETVRLEISIGDNPYKGNDIPMMVAKRDQVSDIIAL